MLTDELNRNAAEEKELLRKQVESLKQTLSDRNDDDSSTVKKKFAELQNRFLDEIKTINDQKIRIKEDKDKEIDSLEKEKEALACKIELLEASIHEE